MEKSKTLRMVFAQWQGGVNPDYVLGSVLLSHIAPPGAGDETVEITIDKRFDAPLSPMDGVDHGEMLLKQMAHAEQILQARQPDKVILFGGDCSVTQVPFDYLKARYADKLGILWLDAHPDVAGPEDSSHLHEMVLGNLLGQNPSSKLTQVKHPFEPNEVMLAGLIKEDLRPIDRSCERLRLSIAGPEDLRTHSQAILDWIKANGIAFVAVHWDLDVLSPDDFRAILTAMPYIELERFPAAVGRMTLKEVERVLKDVSKEAEIVGLSITEHMPWDAMNLRRVLSGLSIFNA